MSRENSVFRKVSDVRYRVIDDEAVVVRQKAGEVLGLNATGARILDLVDGRRSVAEIAAALGDEFAVEASRAATDVASFLAELEASGVVAPVVPAPSPGPSS